MTSAVVGQTGWAGAWRHQTRLWLWALTCALLGTVWGQQAHAQTQLPTVDIFGPRTVELEPRGNRNTQVNQAFTYKRAKDTLTPYTLVVSNLSAAFPQGPQGRQSELEIWHNNTKIASTRDLFQPNGQPVASFQKPLSIKNNNLLLVRLEGKAPVRLSLRVVAQAAPPPLPKLVDLSPNTLDIKHGSAGVLRARLSPTPVAAGTLTVATSQDGIADVPESVRFETGQTRVAIPVYGEGEGRAVITARLNGASESARVDVNPVPARLLSLSPLHSVLSQGATAQYVISIRPRRAGNAHSIHLTSSDPGKLSVPASVTVPQGAGSASFVARAHASAAPGHVLISARLSHRGQRSAASAHVQITAAAAPTVVALLPATSALTLGATAQLSVSLSAAQSRTTTVSLVARAPAVLAVPASMVVPAGQTQASFTVQAQQVGNTLVAASLNNSTAEAAVQVNALPARLDSLLPATATLVLDASAPLRLRLQTPATTSTTVALNTLPPDVLQVAANVLIGAGQQEAETPVTAVAVGQATIIATLSGVSRTASFTVTPQLPKVEHISPSPLGLQVGASARMWVQLTAAAAEAMEVDLSTSNASVLEVPDTLTIPSGAAEQDFSVRGLTVGQAQVRASLNGSTRAATVTVALPPPQVAGMEPPAQDLPQGKLGRLSVSLNRAAQTATVVTLSNSNPAVLAAPAQINIPAGQTGADVALVALAQGQATLSASVAGGGTGTGSVTTNIVTSVVTITAPELQAITLNPANISLSPGQMVQAHAVGTYSDGGTRDISTDAATQWTLTADGSDTVAELSADGKLMGLDTGVASLSVAQAISPTWGNPSPGLVVGQGTVTVGDPLPLALSSANSTLLVGQTTTVSIGAPYPAAARAITVTLEASAGLQAPAQALIGPGLTSVNITVRAISAGAAAGEQLLLASADPFAPGQLAFTVSEPAPLTVKIDAISPTSAPPGAYVTLLGSGFASPANANTVVFQGNIPAVVQSFSGNASAGQVVVQVPDAAQTGPITLTNNLGQAQSGLFTVIREQDFGLQASPAYLRVMQASNGIAVLNLGTSGTRAYQGLAQLTASGLPSGVTAQFEPATLSAYQTGKLILQADPSAPLGTAVVTVKAQATLDGLPWVRESRVNVEVISKANVTGIKGRFVNAVGAGVAGVIVRQDTSTNQVVSDAAGNFLLTGLPSGVTTLRFDATPANALYPIWPYNITLEAGQVLTMADWVLKDPPADASFKAINNATQDQAIADERYPGFSVVLPAGVTITGWDGVVKTRIAVERIDPDKLPVGAPPFPMKEAYQLYFGTPMGGIPSAPIPVTLPNVAEKEPGEKVEIWWFDGSPMGGTGDWKMAGLGTVSPDGTTVASDPGVGLPRFCGVCGLVCLNSTGNPKPPQEPPVTCPEGNPVDTFTGQELASTSGMRCGGRTPLVTGMSYNPVDAFNGRAGTFTSFGLGWTSDYDISFLPFAGVQKRLVMPGGQFINMVDDGTGKYRPVDDPRFSGTHAHHTGPDQWEVVLKGGTKWRFEGFPGITGVIRGGPPLFLTQVIDANGNVVNIGREPTGRALSVSTSEGRGMSMRYGGNGFVDRITDHTGRQQDYEYNANNRISRITDAAGRVTEYTYQATPRFSNTYWEQSLGSSEGSAPANPKTIKTACSAEIPADHQAITSIKYPGSEQPTVNTHGTDRVVKQITASGAEWRFAYRRAGACVVKLYEPARTAYYGNPSQNLTVTETFAFTCIAGQPLSSRQCLDNKTGQPAACTDTVVGTCPDVDSEENRVAGWRFYGGVNLETTVTQPDGHKKTYRFNAKGMPKELVDELGQSTQLIYDARQQLVKVIDPLGREGKHEYDAVGNKVASTNPLGHRHETQYDSVFNRALGQTRFLLGVPSVQGGQQLSYTPVHQTVAIDGKGNTVAVSDATGLGWQMRYDAKGQMVEAVLPALAHATSVPVIANGQASTLPTTARKITLAYNAAGDIAAIKDAQGNETTYRHDPLGRNTGQTDPLGQASTTQYNALDQVTQATDALGQTSALHYDSAARLVGVINPAGVTIEGYSYDSQGKLIRTADALGQHTSITYDSASRPASITDRKGQVTTLAYTPRGQISQISKPGQTVSYQYDAVGRLTEVRDASTVSTHQYDAADRLTQVDTTTAAGSHRLSYRYDSLDRVTQRTLSGSGISTPETTSYEWDLAGRILSHSTLIGGQAHKTSYQYDAAGRLAARKVQAGNQQDHITQRYGYDSLERLAQIKYVKAEGTGGEQLIEQIDYGYDAKGQRISKTTLNNHGVGGQETPMTASYEAANRMQSVTLSIGASTKTYSLSYDPNGNLTGKQNTATPEDKTLYTWDANDRLTQITLPDLNASFSYDVFGRRIQSVITRAGQAPQTVQYLYEGSQALGEIRNNQLSHRLLTGLSLDETIARIAINGAGQKDSAGSRLYLTDALNSVIAQLNDDDSANVANSYGYTPYGESQTVGPDAQNNPSQYTSRENDQTGLYFYRARYYDPVLKRFISSDPIGLAGGMNDQSYVGGNPISLNDPSGLAAPAAGCLAVPPCAAAAAAAAARAATMAAAAAAACKKAWDYVVPKIRDWMASEGTSEGEGADNTEGCIYCVSGDKTSSGKDYIGSTDNLDNRKRDTTDGRDREGATVVDTYPIGDRDERRRKEQQAINDRGGVDNLDNRRNEIAPRKWPSKGVQPP